jgi:DNA modification methylase
MSTNPHLIVVDNALVHLGDCRDILRNRADESFDAIVTDPPYELGFMGKKWDASGVAYDVELWRQCLRVLKPGGHLLAFGGTRTYHRMTVAIEDAGFEIRDSIHWIYGSGFPKSLDVSKAIDKAAGVEREVVGIGKGIVSNGCGRYNWHAEGTEGRGGDFDITAPATDAARQWDGWGTALKPAHEPIVLARKPLAGTVAHNVLTHGTGALNIDATRVATDDRFGGGTKATSGFVNGYEHDGWTPGNSAGRWPANVILDDTITDDWARYFYCAKPSKAERNAGLDYLEARITNEITPPGTKGSNSPRAGANRNKAAQNFHPTVKPLTLMRYLIRLVTPPGGIVLDPFTGSGTTLVAAQLEGFNSTGIEMTDEYLPIIAGRLRWATEQNPPQLNPSEAHGVTEPT